MTPARHRAYKRALQAIDELGPGILQPAEAELLRDAAEGLLLVRDHETEERERLLEEASVTLSVLFGSERLSAAQSERLWTMLAACGPQPLDVRARRHPSLLAS